MTSRRAKWGSWRTFWHRHTTSTAEWMDVRQFNCSERGVPSCGRNEEITRSATKLLPDILKRDRNIDFQQGEERWNTSKNVKIIAFDFFNSHFDEKQYRLHSRKLRWRIILAQHFTKSGRILEKYLNKQISYDYRQFNISRL